MDAEDLAFPKKSLTATAVEEVSSDESLATSEHPISRRSLTPSLSTSEYLEFNSKCDQCLPYFRGCTVTVVSYWACCHNNTNIQIIQNISLFL